MIKPRLKIHLWSGLRAFADGAEVVEVEARTIGEMYQALARDFPGLAPFVEDEISVSVDGRIYATVLTQELTEDNEIYLLQRIKGG